MKEHIQREMVNELRKIAEIYHKHGCLRELISNCVIEYLEKDEAWRKKHEQTIQGKSVKDKDVAEVQGSLPL